MTLEKALAEFSKKLIRKGFSNETIKNYTKQTKRIFREC
jgi:hypothetical protein